MVDALGIKNLFDMNALSMAWTSLVGGSVGAILPLVLLQFIEDQLLGMVNIGNANMNQLSKAAVQSLFDIWKILTVIYSHGTSK